MENAPLTWATEKRKISILVGHEKNPRKISDKQMAELKASINKFNLVEIPAIDTDNRILAGHQRIAAMGLVGRGGEEIDVRVPNRKLTAKERDEYLLRSNKNTGEWDNELLSEFEEELLKEIGWESKDLDKIFDEDEDDDLDADAEAEKIIEPVSKYGDIYELGRHRLMCGDASKLEDVEKLTQKKEVAMIFTDPPYGVSYVGKTKDALEIENDKLPAQELQNFLEKVFAIMFGVLRRGGGWYVCGPAGQPFNMAFNRALEPHNWKHTLVWVKQVFVMGRADYHYRHELIYYGWKEGDKHYFTEDRTEDTVWEKEPSDEDIKRWFKSEIEKTDVWRFKKPARNKEHPTMKPVELVQRAIRNSSKRNDVVLDLFGGSGSTLVAADKINRTCWMCELDPRYVDVIINRWQKLTGEKAKKI